MDEPTTPPRKRKRNPRQGKPPAFQFYPADWLSDLRVAAMTWEERGVYIHLLAYCWREGRIPTDPETLGRVLMMDPARVASLWVAIAPCFDADGRNPRLSRERRAQDEYHKSQSANGKRGSDERWRRHGDANGELLAKNSSASASASASAVGGGAGSGTRDGELPLTDTLSAVGGHAVRFDDFWSLWPWKEGRKKAEEAWKKLKPNRELFEIIRAGIESYRQSPRVTKPDAAIMLAATWLNQRRWEDEHSIATSTNWEKTFLAKGETDGEGN
jgi:uncharacterized protein YdaU (DUF1376 family)